MTVPADRTPFVMTVTAAPADIDELGHVNNIVYLRWVQQVATAHWAAVAPAAHQAAFLWVIIRHEIDYLRPSFDGETLTLTTWVGTPRGARFPRHVRITGADGQVRAEALTTWALIDRATGKAIRVPPEVAAPFIGM